MSIGTVNGESALPALLLQRVVGGEGGADAADAAGDDDAEPLRVDLRRARVGPRLARGDERELLAPVQPARLHPVDHRRRVDRGGRGDLHRQVRVPSPRSSLRDAAAPGQQRLPRCVATSPPTGVVAPRPVTTTRGWSARTVNRSLSSVWSVTSGRARCGAARRRAPGQAETPALRDVVDDVLDGLEVLQLVVGDLHAELVLRRPPRSRPSTASRCPGRRRSVLSGVTSVGGDAGDLVDDLGEAGRGSPARSWPSAPSFSFMLVVGGSGGGPRRQGAGSGYRDHLCGVADARAEPEQQTAVA